VQAFIKVLEGYGVTATPRVRRGIDIDAGCGQASHSHRFHNLDRFR
jgi:adenine C2-methylase RlmN of 23S rRNA A2503 and tRNA A37